MGRSKAGAGQYIIFSCNQGNIYISREGTRAIYILPRKEAFSYPLIETLVCRLLQQKLPILVTFPSGIEFYVLIITQNVIIFIVADIYKQEATVGDFLNYTLKDTVL